MSAQYTQQHALSVFSLVLEFGREQHLPTYLLDLFRCVQIFLTLWTMTRQAPCPWDSPGKNTGVSCHALLQGIFLTQRSNWPLMSLALASVFFNTSVTWEAQGTSGLRLKS